MSRTRKAKTITISISEGDGPLAQLRVASGSQEETWAVSMDNQENVIETALSAAEGHLRFEVMLLKDMLGRE